MNSRQIKLIATYSLRYSVRGGVGLVFLLVAMTFGLTVAHVALLPVEVVTEKVVKHSDENTDEADVRREILDDLVDHAREPVAWVLGAGGVDKIKDPGKRAEARDFYESWTDYLLDDKPAALSAILLILLWGWPFVVAFGAFDIFSSDMASRGLRFQLLRADRSTIYYGRLLGSVLTFVGVLALLMITVILYMGFKLPFYGWGALISWGFYGLLTLVCLSLPYIGLCSWISAGFSSAFGSLTICCLIIGAVPLFAVVGRSAHEAAGYVIYALPWGFQHYLFHPGVGLTLMAVAGCLGFTALFCFLGHRKFTTRDL